MLSLKPIAHAILEDYVLPWNGTHGVAHWARVLENGLRLAQETGANVEVVQLFAVFHDSRRVNEGTDDGHGLRGADLAAELRSKKVMLFNVPYVNEAMFPPSLAKDSHQKRDYHNARLKAYCDEHGIPLADICSYLRDEHFADELHPNGAGARIIAGDVLRCCVR